MFLMYCHISDHTDNIKTSVSLLNVTIEFLQFRIGLESKMRKHAALPSPPFVLKCFIYSDF